MTRPWLILFSDLDGTLLDHDSYDWRPARPALDRLAQLGLPLVLNSSKTAAELAVLREQLDNHHPYIVENGASVVIPADYFGPGPEQVITSGRPRQAILDCLAQLRGRGFSFTGFSDLTDHELADLTGLSRDAAARALRRHATEPLLWQGDAGSLASFREALAGRGLRLVEGGRFWHVMDAFDKADGLNLLMRAWRRHWPSRRLLSVALGDSPNDQQMLAGADIAVIIHSARSARVELPAGHRVIHSRAPGPEGWNGCVQQLLRDHGY